jgi:hypothetical protein
MLRKAIVMYVRYIGGEEGEGCGEQTEAFGRRGEEEGCDAGGVE